MTIALILHPYGEKTPSGLGRMALETTKALIAASPHTRFILALKEPPTKELSLPGSNWEVVTGRGGIFWLDSLVRRTKHADVHVFFTPVLPLLVRPKRTVVVVHDFAYRRFPDTGLRGKLAYLTLTYTHRRALRRADRVVAVSNATQAEAAAFARVPQEKIVAIYNGTNDVCTAPQEPVELKEPYFLLGGGVKGRKNTLAAIEAYAYFAKGGSLTLLAILGEPRGAYGERVKERLRELGIEERVRFLAHASDGQLCFLYRHARAFLFPSLVEGFGMMPVEAMALGTPTVCLDTAVLREVMGEGAYLVPEGNTEAFSEALARLDRDEALRAELSRKGRERASRFTWKSTGEEFLKVLRYTASL